MPTVKLISVTQGPAQSSPERVILRCARASSSNPESSDPGLLRYCIKHRHWSPFEMAHMTVGVQTSRAIARQMIRHRSFSFQEFSQRYAEAQEFELPEEYRQQATNNRQSSLDPIEHQESARTFVKQAAEHCERIYRHLLVLGVAREQARLVLPEATMSKLFMTGSARSWIHYLELRTHQDTQLEHREAAWRIQDIFLRVFPNTYQACLEEGILREKGD